MRTTVKTLSIAMTKDDIKTIDYLCESTGDTKSTVVKKSLLLYKTKIESERNDDENKTV